MELNELKARLSSLVVFRKLLKDEVIESLMKHLENPSNENYAEFVSRLYEANGGNLGLYIRDICENNENVYVRTVAKGKPVSDCVKQSVREELKALQAVADLTKEELCNESFLPDFSSKGIEIAACFEERTSNIGKYGYGVFAKHPMFYVDEDNSIVPVKNPDKISLGDFVDYERERNIILDNTKALLCGKPAANMLLTGDAGTGKSSTVKAVCNELFDEGLRIIEVRKDRLSAIPEILDELAENPLKFILFIDDLSFLKDDDNFNSLKAVLEGSVSAKSKNVVIYATSNRRHIIKEKFSEREGDDVHRNETMQELVSLSERFGIHVSFKKPDKKTYLNIVRHLCLQNGIDMSEESMELKAERFALERGGRSARLARQFVDLLLSK